MAYPIIAVVNFQDTSSKAVGFNDVRIAKSYAGHEFNRTDVLSVQVSESDNQDKVYLNLDKNKPNERISIR